MLTLGPVIDFIPEVVDRELVDIQTVLAVSKNWAITN